MKVASGYKVAKRLISKYGDRNLKDVYKEYSHLNLRDNSNKTFGLSSKDYNDGSVKRIKKELGEYQYDSWAGDYVKRVKNDVYNGLNKLLYENVKINSEICNYYAKKGYDAIVDIEDYLGGFEYPLILLEPEKSARVRSVRKLPKRSE